MGISMDSLPPRYQKQAARKLDPVAYEKALQFFHAEESAKNPARQAQGSISRATGEGFEAQILTACAYYRAHGIAEIDKTPEPIKVISGRRQNPSGTTRRLSCWRSGRTRPPLRPMRSGISSCAGNMNLL